MYYANAYIIYYVTGGKRLFDVNGSKIGGSATKRTRDAKEILKQFLLKLYVFAVRIRH